MKISQSCWLFVTPGTIQSMEFSRPEYWSGYPFPSLRIFPTQGSNLGLPHCRWIPLVGKHHLKLSLSIKIPWRRERLPNPVFWPGEFRGLYSPWGHKELDTTERLSLFSSLSIFTLLGSQSPELFHLEKLKLPTLNTNHLPFTPMLATR